MIDSIGAALASLIAQLVGLILTFYSSRKYLKVGIDMNAMMKSAIASMGIVPILTIFQISLVNILSPVIILILEISTAIIIYLMLLFILKALNEQDFMLLRHYFPQKLSKVVEFFQRSHYFISSI